MADHAGLVLLARTGSRRLPAKSLQLVGDRPLIAHQIDRLRRATRSEIAVLATTALAGDDALCVLARDAGMRVFRGEDENVVARLVQVAEAFRLTHLAVVGGDDVFCEGRFVDRALNEIVSRDADFVVLDDLPFGTSPFAVRVSALRQVKELVGTGTTDGWERHFDDPRFRRVAVPMGEPALAHPELRLDVDYPEDLALVRAIHDRLHRADAIYTIEEIVTLLTESEPRLADLNRAAHERWLAERRRVETAAGQARQGDR